MEVDGREIKFGTAKSHAQLLKHPGFIFQGELGENDVVEGISGLGTFLTATQQHTVRVGSV